MPRQVKVKQMTPVAKGSTRYASKHDVIVAIATYKQTPNPGLRVSSYQARSA